MTVFGDPTYYAISNASNPYQALCNTTADFLNRADLVTAIPNFVGLATARLRQDLIDARYTGLLTYVAMTSTANPTLIPTTAADFAAPYALEPTTNSTGQVFEYITPDEFKKIKATGWPPQNNGPVVPPYTQDGTAPVYYTIEGRYISILPVPTVSAPWAYNLWYYKLLTELTSTTFNDVVSQYPDLYLYATLSASAPYLMADERVALWEKLYTDALARVNIVNERAMRQQSKLVSARKSF